MFEDDDRDDQIEILRKRIHELEIKSSIDRLVIACIIRVAANREQIGELFQETWNTARGAFGAGRVSDDDATRYAAQVLEQLAPAFGRRII